MSGTDRSTPTSDSWLFLRKLFQHGRKVNSVAPSSTWFARALLREIAWDKTECLVELGAGTGPVTAEILRVAPPTCKCVFIEYDPEFCVRLRQRFPEADIVQGDAGDLESILAERGIKSVDHIIGGLPLPSFPAESRDRILDASRRLLKPEGTYRQMTFLPWVYYKMYHRYFERLSFCWVLRNLPPGGYYMCRQPRASVPGVSP